MQRLALLFAFIFALMLLLLLFFLVVFLALLLATMFFCFAFVVVVVVVVAVIVFLQAHPGLDHLVIIAIMFIIILCAASVGIVIIIINTYPQSQGGDEASVCDAKEKQWHKPEFFDEDIFLRLLVRGPALTSTAPLLFFAFSSSNCFISLARLSCIAAMDISLIFTFALVSVAASKASSFTFLSASALMAVVGLVASFLLSFSTLVVAVVHAFTDDASFPEPSACFFDFAFDFAFAFALPFPSVLASGLHLVLALLLPIAFRFGRPTLAAVSDAGGYSASSSE
jgi:hypothetical protein